MEGRRGASIGERRDGAPGDGVGPASRSPGDRPAPDTAEGLARHRIVVAGHVCLDVIPALPGEARFLPGTLIETGPVEFTSGGAVANVGLALTRLGARPTLLAKVGDDQFGRTLRSILEASGAQLALHTAAGESTSYTIVLSPPGRDRTFLHHSGCNDTFTAAELQIDRWKDADILHFGYPPLMREVYRDGGASLAAAFARLRSHGVTVSLDMATPDPAGASGRVDWRGFLERVLPEVDLFLPSWNETWMMLEPKTWPEPPEPDDLRRIGEELIEMGAALVGLKLGDDGLYLRSAGAGRLARAGRAAPPLSWADRSHHAPNFRVAAKGTTGAGDSTIAGLLAALAERMGMEEAATAASAVGASSVEGVDATSGVTSWRATLARVAGGWQRDQSRFQGPKGGES